MTQIKLPLHHLGEVVCELNLTLYWVKASGEVNKVAPSTSRGVACELNFTLYSS